jgi:hypothetical protein
MKEPHSPPFTNGSFTVICGRLSFLTIRSELRVKGIVNNLNDLQKQRIPDKSGVVLPRDYDLSKRQARDRISTFDGQTPSGSAARGEIRN